MLGGGGLRLGLWGGGWVDEVWGVGKIGWVGEGVGGGWGVGGLGLWVGGWEGGG